MKRKSSVLVASLLIFSMLLGACTGGGTSSGGSASSGGGAAGSSPAASAADTDTVIIALQGEPTSLDAQYPDDGNMRFVTDNVLDCLFEIDGITLEAEPSLAAGITMLDEVTWEVKLREGVKFHDGVDFTAEDAAYSINRVLDPDYGSQILSDFDTIKEAVVVDPTTINIITHNADPLLSKRLTKLVMLSKPFTESRTNEELTLVCNGTGPYKFVEWRRGIDITIERNEDYWGEKPVIKKAVFRTLEEPATRLAALKAGEINIAVNMYPEYADEMPKVFTEVGYETYWIRFNQLHGQMIDQNIRLAANYAIDRQALADNLFLGYASPAEGQMAKQGYFGYNSAVTGYEYDPEKAKSLLAEAGYNGEVVELISERGRWLKDGEITEAAAAMLTEAGFNVTVRILSWNEWLDLLFDKTRTPDLQLSATSNEYFDVDRTLSALVYSKGTQSALNNPEIDKLIEDARTELDQVKRQQMYEELAVMLYEDPFAIYLLYLNDLHGGSANLNWAPRRDSKILVSEMSFS